MFFCLEGGLEGLLGRWEDGEVKLHFSMGSNVCLVLRAKAAGRRGKVPGTVPTAL